MLVAAAIASASFCPVISPPADGPVVAPFAPIGRYAGHWGIDYAAPPGTGVHAPASGIVSFAGSVAGRLSVSIDHGRGIVTTVTYLSAVSTSRGVWVDRGDVIASSGRAHDLAAVHLSARIAGVYVDPGMLFRCQMGDISDALWLTTVPE